MAKIFCACVWLCLVAAVAQAQSPDTYELKLYTVGSAAPLSTTALAPADVLCNQPAAASANTVNPRGFQWDDPALAGRVCVWRQSTAGPLVALATPGIYEAALVRANASGVSLESARVSFSKAPLPAAVTGLRPVR
jgi:hypothetical protein